MNLISSEYNKGGYSRFKAMAPVTRASLKKGTELRVRSPESNLGGSTDLEGKKSVGSVEMDWEGFPSSITPVREQRRLPKRMTLSREELAEFPSSITPMRERRQLTESIPLPITPLKERMRLSKEELEEFPSSITPMRERRKLLELERKELEFPSPITPLREKMELLELEGFPSPTTPMKEALLLEELEAVNSGIAKDLIYN